VLLVVEVRWIAGARGLRGRRWNPEALEDATLEPHESAFTYAAHDGLEVDERRWRRGVKDNAAVGIANEDGIEHHDVHVHVQVQAPAEARHEGDCTTLAAREPIPMRVASPLTSA
jgi:hypothetical protein